jgi:hypothetical protein
LVPSLIVWTIYCGIIGLIFTTIKVFNYRLHHMFDTSEVIEEKPDKTEEEDKGSKQGNIG